jgi:hypothetical protein
VLERKLKEGGAQRLGERGRGRLEVGQDAPARRSPTRGPLRLLFPFAPRLLRSSKGEALLLCPPRAALRFTWSPSRSAHVRTFLASATSQPNTRTTSLIDRLQMWHRPYLARTARAQISQAICPQS